MWQRARVRTRSRLLVTDTLIGFENFNIKKFAESLAKAGRKGVKWERRKLEWILEEEKKQEQANSDAA